MWIEIAIGVFMGVFAFWSFLSWKQERRNTRRLEQQLAGLGVDQLRMLGAFMIRRNLTAWWVR
jgi:hypothetical protein